ncbi:MAG: hypothetical protein ACON4Z_08765 [Planctomycetota bacterium]
MSWRRILLSTIALVVVLTATTLALLQNSSAATDFVRRQLESLILPAVRLDDTALQLQQGRFELRGLTVADPRHPDRALAGFERAYVDVQLDPLAGLVAPRHLVVEGLELTAGPELPEPAQLLAPAALRWLASSSGAELPVIELRSARATFHAVADAPPLEVVDVDLQLTPFTADATKLQVAGSLRLLRPAAELSLAGEFDTSSGAAVISLSTRGVRCSEQVTAELAQLAGVGELDVAFAGDVESLRLVCRVPPRDAEDRTPSVELEARCHQVQLDVPTLPPIVRSADVQVLLDTAANGLLQATVAQEDAAGAIDVRTRITGLTTTGDAELGVEVAASGRDLVWNDDLRSALRSFRIGRQVVDALRPSAGSADLELYLRDPHVTGGDAEMDLRLRDVAMSFQGFGDPDERIGFPLPLEHGRGEVVLRDRMLMLRDLEADISEGAGGGRVELSGHLDVRPERPARIHLDIEGRGVAFRGDLRGALATLLRDDGALYDKLAPSGRADVRVVIRPPDELPGGFGVEVTPRGATMRWAGFPYELEDLGGTIQVGQADARFDLGGRHGAGRLTMQGRIPLREDHGPGEGFEAVVTLDRLQVDEDLRVGVAQVVPELDQPWRETAPRGALSGAVRVWRPRPDAPIQHDVRLQLADVDLQLPLAPWRATHLRGEVLVQGSGAEARIDFDALRGDLEDGASPPAKLALLGHLESGPAVVRDLAFVVRDLALSEQLGESLDELEALDLQTWRSLQPAGQVDLVVREQKQPGASSDVELVVQLVDVRSAARMLPRPAEHMTGELHVHRGELTFRDVRAELGGANVRCANGRVRQLGAGDARTEIAFEVHAEDFPVDDGLANLFTDPLRTAVLERELRGWADVEGLRLRFLVPGEGNPRPFSTTLSGGINLQGLDVLLGAARDGLQLQGLRGEVQLAESTVVAGGGQLAGTLSGGALTMLGQPFEAVEATFVADAQQLRVDEVRARLHDGEVRSASAPGLRYDLPDAATPDGRLAADLRFEDVDVAALLSASGWRNPPYRGAATGELQLIRLDGDDVVGAEAAGRLQVARGDLGKVPLFTAIYAQLPPADQPRFRELDVGFRLADEELRFAPLEVRSDILAAVGQGQLALDGYLDVEMELDSLLGQSADPLVMPWIDYLAKNLVSFRLYGHLRDLRASTEFLGQGPPSRRAILPMPPKRTRRAAPGF